MKTIKTKNFILKCMLALVPIMATVLYTAFFEMSYMDNEYPAWRYDKEAAYGRLDMADEGQEGVSLILGDSRAMADLVPSEMPGNVVNLALGGATSIEMYYTYVNYVNHNEKPDRVIIMFAPFHYSFIDNFWERTVYFNYLRPDELTDLYKNARLCGSKTLLKEGLMDDILSCGLRMPSKYLPALINAGFYKRYGDNSQIYERLLMQKGHDFFGRADGSSDLNWEVNYDRMHDSGDFVLIDFYLKRLLNRLDNDGCRVMIVQAPMNGSSYALLKESYVEDFGGYLAELNAVHKDMLISSFIPCYDDMYFGDSSHLNEKGAMKYTAEFVEGYYADD